MLAVFNNNDKTCLAAAPIQLSSERPELESVRVFLNRLRRDTSNRPLAAASLGRYGIYSLRMRKPRLLTNDRFNLTFFNFYYSLNSLALNSRYRVWIYSIIIYIYLK